MEVKTISLKPHLDFFLLKSFLVNVMRRRQNSTDQLYYFSPGTRFGASRPFDLARSIAFCSFLRPFLGLAWLWTNVFFFSLLERHSQCFVMCLSNGGTGKSPDLSDFQPCRSHQSLAITPGQSSWPELRKGDIQEEQSISLWRKMIVWIKKPKGSDERLSSKRKSASSLEVIFEAGRVHRCVGYMYRQIYKSRSTKQAHRLQNRHSNQTLVHLIIIFFIVL